MQPNTHAHPHHTHTHITVDDTVQMWAGHALRKMRGARLFVEGSGDRVTHVIVGLPRRTLKVVYMCVFERYECVYSCLEIRVFFVCKKLSLYIYT